MQTTDDLSIPEFLSRPFDLESWRREHRVAARRRARSIPYPKGGYARLLRQNRRPDGVTPATWDALRQQIADERTAMQARFAKLRGQR